MLRSSNSTCKGPEAGARAVHWRVSREPTVAGVQWSERSRGETGTDPYSSVF